MDFTEAFRHSSVGCIAFSPGSTFLAYVSGSQPRTLLVRASSTLQVIRSWDFVTDIDSIEWSSDGSFVLLTSNSTQRNHEGVAYVVSLDPGREANDGSDENQGWVARIASGSEGLVGSTWTPPVGPRSVVLFSQHQLRASLYSLPDQTISAIEGPKRSNLIWSPKRPSNFALILKGEDRDYLHVFSCARVTADMLRESAYVLRSEEQWQFERSFPLASNDAADALWSPDGLHIAVWEGQLEYKLLVYTPLGKLRSTFMIDPVLEGEPTTVAPHLDSTSTARPPKPSAALSQSVLRGSATAAGSFGANNSGSSGSSSNNNSPHAGHSTKSKNASDMVSAVAGGGLGIRQVQWHPSGKYIAVGGYDEQVRILESSEWLECASLDLAKRTIGAPPASVVSSVYGPLKAWREPTNWFEETRARGIVTCKFDFLLILFPSHRLTSKTTPVEPASLPIAPAALRVDTGKASPKLGVSWMQWSPDGSLIASFNGERKRLFAVRDIRLTMLQSRPLRASSFYHFCSFLPRCR